jgi:pilus assembly protein FimV
VARPTPAPEQASPVESTAPATAAAPAEGGIAGGSYAVQRNDTLSQIAGRVSTSSGVSANKTMLALFRANPQAFSGNINRLRSGSVLRIPDAAEIEALAGMNASAEVSRQNSEWREGDSTSSPTAEEEGRLRLVAPTQGTDSATVGGGSNQAASVGNGTPGGNIAADNNRVALNDAGLAELQRQQSNEPPAMSTPEVPVDEPVASEPVAPPEAEALPEASPAPAAVQETKPTPAAKRAAAPKQAPQPSLLDQLLDQLRQFWWVLVAAGVACGVLVMFLRRRREPGADEVFADIMPPLTDTGAMRTSRMRSAPPPAPADHEEDSGPVVLPLRPEPQVDIASDFPFDTPVSAPMPPPSRSRAEEPVAAAPPPRAATARAEQQDVLGEADFHMAYGLYDQAADLVKIAMQREPERRDFKLKLLEIYFVWGNRELFLETAEELYASRAEAAPGEWEKVLIMGKQISPDSPMFAQGAGGVHALDLVDVNLEGGENRVDVDLFAEQDMDAAVGGDSAPRRSEPSLDFLLDRDDDTRDTEGLARTQETPTVESPVWQRRSAASSIVDRIDARNNFEQTAELSIDDLGLDVDESMTETGRLDEATSLERTLTAEELDDTQMQRGMKLADNGDTQRKPRPLRDDELTQLAPSLGSSDRTLRAPALENAEETGTIYVSDIEQGPGDTVEQKRPIEINNDTAELRQAFFTADETLQQHSLLDDETALAESTLAGLKLNEESSEEPSEDIDFDLSATSTEAGDTFATMLNEAVASDKDSGDATALEPLTMSEVGTKLDLARAYMDMGDPDGARSILEEVMQEGNATQQQEAQQLLESVR